MDKLTAAILAHEEVASYLSGSHGITGYQSWLWFVRSTLYLTVAVVTGAPK